MEPARVSLAPPPGCGTGRRGGRRPGAPCDHPPTSGTWRAMALPGSSGSCGRWQRRRPQRGGRRGLVLRPPTRQPRAPGRTDPWREGRAIRLYIAEMVTSLGSVGRWDESRITSRPTPPRPASAPNAHRPSDRAGRRDPRLTPPAPGHVRAPMNDAKRTPKMQNARRSPGPALAPWPSRSTHHCGGAGLPPLALRPLAAVTPVSAGVVRAAMRGSGGRRWRRPPHRARIAAARFNLRIGSAHVSSAREPDPSM
jgi:hypothetical protein